MENRAKHAEALFNDGYSCAQSILASFAPEFQLDPQTAYRLAGAFGAGIARQGETCGAVTGALMVIGLKHGMVQAGDLEARDKTYAVAQRFMEQFRLRHGTTECSDLLGVDISLPEGYQFAREQNLFNDHCPGYVRAAAEILEQILKEA
jgi:C_GCAxxG_C_C family probable redox protein